jgi:beta-glucosidase
MTFPRSEGQIPVYHAKEPTGRPYTGPAEGFAKFRSVYLDAPNDGLFPFGFGLGYAPFSVGEAKLGKTALKGDRDRLTVRVPLTNAGKVAGADVVQLYLSDPVASLSQPVKRLIDFAKVTVAAGATAEVEFTITTDSLSFHTAETLTRFSRGWEPGEFVLHVGLNARDTVPYRFVWER